MCRRQRLGCRRFHGRRSSCEAHECKKGSDGRFRAIKRLQLEVEIGFRPASVIIAISLWLQGSEPIFNQVQIVNSHVHQAAAVVFYEILTGVGRPGKAPAMSNVNAHDASDQPIGERLPIARTLGRCRRTIPTTTGWPGRPRGGDSPARHRVESQRFLAKNRKTALQRCDDRVLVKPVG